MRVTRHSKNYRGEWECDGPSDLPDTCPEVAVLTHVFFPVRSITIEYEDGTELKYVK